jgi:gluconokinase
VLLVVMGVAGCGKSSLGLAVAEDLGLPMIEGDAHHSAASVAKMSQGIALTDADRAGWLNRLAALLGEAHQRGAGTVLSCSALKRAYRERLRADLPAGALRFLWLELSPAEALRRVSQRGSHFFSANLVDSQFAALESPLGEPGVLRLDATKPLVSLRAQVAAWLAEPAPA